MFLDLLREKLGAYLEYGKIMRDAILLRSTFFKTYDIQDAKVFIGASRYIYAICSAAVLIFSALYFWLGVTRPDFYEMIPLNFMVTMGLVCFISMSLLRVYRITFGEFFVCFAYVMGTYCVFWVAARLVRSGVAIYQAEPPMMSGETTTRDMRQMLSVGDALLKYWDLVIGFYFSLALGVFLVNRAGAQKFRIATAILAGLGAFMFFETVMSYGAKLWLVTNQCTNPPSDQDPLKSERLKLVVAECEKHASSKLRAVRFYANLHRGLALHQQMQHAQSASVLIEAARNDPEFVLEPGLLDTLTILGREYAAQGYYKEGLALANEAIRGRPSDPRLLAWRGSIYLGLANVDAALADFQEAIKLRSELADAFFYRGLAFEERGDWEKADSDINKAVELQGEARFLRARGRLKSLLGDHDLAIGDLKQAIALEPKDAESLVELGQVYRRNSNPAEALRQYLDAIQINDNFARAHLALGELYKDANDNVRAKTHFERACSLYNQSLAANPNSVDSLVGRGNCNYFVSADFNAAIEDYSNAMRLNLRTAPHYVASLLVSRGKAYGRLERRESAIADFAEAIRVDAKSADARYRRGKEYYAVRENERALEDFTHAIQFDPKQSQYYEGRGLAYHAIGKYRLAIADYTTFLELAPNSALVLARRCALRSIEREGEAALKDCNDARQLKAETPAQIALYRGMALWNVGQIAEAKAAYEEASDEAEKELASVRITGGTDSIARALGGLSWFALFARRFDQALEAAEEAIDSAPTILWPKSNRAHALMFQGKNDLAKLEGARRVYKERKGEMLPGSGPWNRLIAEEFKILREGGLGDLMDTVEREFRENG